MYMNRLTKHTFDSWSVCVIFVKRVHVSRWGPQSKDIGINLK